MSSNYLDRYVVIQVCIALAILISTPFARHSIFIIQTIGAILLMIGTVFLIISGKNLGFALTPVVTPKENAQLVTSGMYRLVRHPIYTGVILLAIGWSLFWCSLLSFLFSLMLIVFFDFKTKKEEFLLSQKFLEYANYKKQVKKKMIPFIY